MRPLLKHLKLIILFALTIILLLGCTEEDELNSREYITTCYKFVEKGTNVPIVDMSILIHYGYKNVLSSQGVTDEIGEWCFKHWNDNGQFATPYTYVHNQWCYNFPMLLPLNGSKNTIELIPRSNYLKIHIINVEPSSINDKIKINIRIRVREKYAIQYSNSFIGKEIDTSYISPAIKGENTIRWSIYSHDSLKSSHTDQVIIEQYRDTVDYKIEY